jgi:iron complex outermembrane receptor protein
MKESNRLAAATMGDPNLSAQTGKVRIRGGEIEVLAKLTDDLNIITGYSYVDAKVIGGDAESIGKRVEDVPSHQASLWGVYRLTSVGLPNFTVGAGVRFVGESHDGTDNPLLTTPSFTLFDAMMRYENGPWRFQVNANNIGDKIHFTTCLARGDCFYGARRTVVGTLTYKF